MRKEPFSTVFTGKTSNEADLVVHKLRKIGLHPADLALTAQIAMPKQSTATFPVKVPTAELNQARHLLRQRP